MAYFSILLAGLLAAAAASSHHPAFSIDLATKWFQEIQKEVEAAGSTTPGFQGGAVDGSTIFAPTDQAFITLAHILGLDSVDKLFVEGETKEPAQKVAAYHITVDKVLSYKDIPEGKTEVQTARDMKPATRDGGSVLTVNKRKGKVWLKGGGRGSYAQIVKPDIKFGDNIVHVIDAVLLPEGFDAYSDYIQTTADKAAGAVHKEFNKLKEVHKKLKGGVVSKTKGADDKEDNEDKEDEDEDDQDEDDDEDDDDDDEAEDDEDDEEENAAKHEGIKKLKDGVHQKVKGSDVSKTKGADDEKDDEEENE